MWSYGNYMNINIGNLIKYFSTLSVAFHDIHSLFGFFTYATYDLTNLATLKAWPITITVIDLIWGTLVTAVTSSLVVLLIGG